MKLSGCGKLRIPKKYQGYINEVDYWGDMYSLDLKTCCDIDGGSHLYNYETQRELLQDLPSIYVIKSEEDYLYNFGEDFLENYREEYKELMGEYPPKKSEV